LNKIREASEKKEMGRVRDLENEYAYLTENHVAKRREYLEKIPRLGVWDDKTHPLHNKLPEEPQYYDRAIKACLGNLDIDIRNDFFHTTQQKSQNLSKHHSVLKEQERQNNLKKV
jgi:hypothetical protein